MYLLLFERLSLNICLLVTVAYLVSKTKLFNRIICGIANTEDKLILVLLFGCVGIIGTYIGIPIQGALANARIVGVVAGGLLGGPGIGFAAGILAGGHRILLGGATAWSCGMATILNGFIAGWFADKYGHTKLSWKQTTLIGLSTNLLEMLMIFIFTKPFPTGIGIVESIGLPMVIMNSIGITVFYRIAISSLLEEERIAALQAQKVLEITNLTLPILRMGLNEKTAFQVAQIIYERANLVAVSITDRKNILAHVGKGSDHHMPGHELRNKATMDAIESGEIKLAATCKEIGCSEKKCPLNAALVVPLKFRDYVVGTISIYREGSVGISKVDWEFASGLGRLFSTQLELAELDVQAKLISKAEMRALEAQINPHFLFNAINTIVSFCRTDSDKAKTLLIKLGDFFRRNLQGGGRIVTLREECEHIDDYVGIEQARFSDKLTVIQKISKEALEWPLPSLTLQPLVENAIKHGIYPLRGQGIVVIEAEVTQQVLVITITDNGVGIDEDTLIKIKKGARITSDGLGIGLNNVSQRLQYLYRGDAVFLIDSKDGKGTVITIKIPEASHLDLS